MTSYHELLDYFQDYKWIDQRSTEEHTLEELLDEYKQLNEA